MKYKIAGQKMAFVWVGLWGVLLLTACGLREAPQTETAYIEAPYPSQVSIQTIRDLERRFPTDFWKDRPFTIPPEKRIRIGIREFLSLTDPPESGKMVTEIFNTTFAKSNAFALVERQQLDKVLNEFELNQSGAIDPGTAEEIGNITGLDAIVTGSISQIGNDQRVDARVIDVKTGQIILAETLTPVFDNQNVNLRPVDYQNIANLARRLVDQMAARYYP